MNHAAESRIGTLGAGLIGAALAMAAAAGAWGQIPTPPGTAIEINADGTARFTPPEPPAQATIDLLAALEAHHLNVPSVRGKFDQTLVSMTFIETIKSEAEFWFIKPYRFRCDYGPPEEITNLITEDAMYMHVPENKQVNRIAFRSDAERDQQLHMMVIAFGFKTTELVKDYAIRSSEADEPLGAMLKASFPEREGMALIELEPWGPRRETSPFTKLRLWIDKATQLPVRVWYERYDGDEITMDITEIEAGAEIDEKIFEPRFPGSKMIDGAEEAPAR